MFSSSFVGPVARYIQVNSIQGCKLEKRSLKCYNKCQHLVDNSDNLSERKVELLLHIKLKGHGGGQTTQSEK
jgi:hypothetical protein